MKWVPGLQIKHDLIVDPEGSVPNPNILSVDYQ